VKVAELTNVALDWAVAEAANLEYTFDLYVGSDECDAVPLVIVNGRQWNPTSLWSQGGPIIEREGISINFDGDGIHTDLTDIEGRFFQGFDGLRPLIAAMRCFVASRLGDEVDVPDELM
jgi:hypothetical protein